MFVGEVKDEYVVGLPVDRLLDSIGLVGDEGSEQADMTHPCDNVVPVRVSQVEVGFFGEEEGGS